MTGRNGEPEGPASLWPEDEAPVPLLGALSAERPAEHAPANGDGPQAAPPATSEPVTAAASADDFSAERMLRATADAPASGWRLGVYRLSGGLVRVDPSTSELHHRELVARVKTPLQGCRKVAFISRKGGVGKTTTCVCSPVIPSRP